jgi:hypothetical protein
MADSQTKCTFRISGVIGCADNSAYNINVTLTANNVNSDMYPKIDYETTCGGGTLWNNFGIVYVQDPNNGRSALYIKTLISSIQINLNIVAASKNTGPSNTPTFYENTSYSLSFTGTISNSVDSTLGSTYVTNYDAYSSANLKIRHWNENGNVGIGTTNPPTILSLNGGSSLANKQLAISANYAVSTVNDTLGALSFYSNNHGYENARIQSCCNVGGVDNNADLRFFTRLDYANFTERMRIDRAGNVGIGIANPQYNLDVNGIGNFSTASNTTLFVRADATGTYASDNGQLLITGKTNTNLRLGMMVDTTQNVCKIQGGEYSVGLLPLVLNSAGGNVGIGTTNPQSTLDVSKKTDSIILPQGTTAQRPAVTLVGQIRYNTTTNALEYYNGTNWCTIGSTVLALDTSTLTGWTTSSALITVDAGVQFRFAGNDTYCYYNTGITPYNHTISFEIAITTNDYPFFYFGCNSTGAGWTARPDSRSGNPTYFLKSNSWTSFSGSYGSISKIATSNVWTNCKIVITNGTSFIFYMNGVAYTSLVQSQAMSGGYIGMYDSAGGSYFRNIVITSP